MSRCRYYTTEVMDRVLVSSLCIALASACAVAQAGRKTGEAGAITILGPEYHLPAAIQLTNSGWLRGYPVPAPDTLIVVGWSLLQVQEAFTACRVAGHNGNSLGVRN
jgi:hypothetical protein